MKYVIILTAFAALSAQAQNFSPSGGAGTQSSPGSLGAGTVLSSPSATGGGITSPTSSAADSFGTVPNPARTDATGAVNPPLLNSNTLEPSTANPSPNPLPGELNTSDSFDTSLIDGTPGTQGPIQAEEADPGFDFDTDSETGTGSGTGTNPPPNSFETFEDAN